MGLVHAEIRLTNGGDLYDVKRNLMDKDDVRQININCLADSGAYILCINENIQEYLQLPFIDRRRSQNAHGHIEECDLVGPVEVEFEGKRCLCEALVLPGGSEPLLGAIPMEMMDLHVLPLEQKVVANRDSPLYKIPSIRPVPAS